MPTPPVPHAWGWQWVAEGPPSTDPPPAVPAAPRQPQGVPAGDTTQQYYAVVKKLRTYSGAQRYCQDVYRGRLASVHSAARNQELQKLAQSYHIVISPWIGAVTSRRVRALWGQGAAKGCWELLWGVRGWGCFVWDEPGAGGWVLRREGLAAGCWFLGLRGWGGVVGALPGD
ncbi:proteoglycan 3-like [Melozone crissalis]|uniref:proteoglycan 3-like n=1 Tax=Melozone crissalis TaxID=40204 RepID=UPI0023DCCA6B|nr:proteoglycan 3-like [Melozone crissalis]